MGLIVHVDGAARGNPGPAGAGVVVQADDGRVIHEGGYFLGHQTNNAAEYHALIRGLQRAVRCGDSNVVLRSDSELLVRQIIGQYRVRNPKLAVLFREVQLLLLRIRCWRIEHVPREANRRADELANLAIDQQRDVVVFDADPQEHAAAADSGPETHVDDEAPASQPTGSAEAEAALPAAELAEHEVLHVVRVTLVTPPRQGHCPAAAQLPWQFDVTASLPAGICLHAAHALLPTILAVLNTPAREVSALPMLTVRCGRGGCGATFQVSAVTRSNGRAKRN